MLRGAFRQLSNDTRGLAGGVLSLLSGPNKDRIELTKQRDPIVHFLSVTWPMILGDIHRGIRPLDPPERTKSSSGNYCPSLFFIYCGGGSGSMSRAYCTAGLDEGKAISEGHLAEKITLI